MSEETAETTETQAEEWEVQRDAYKQQGDDAFRSGDYAEAVAQYTQALSVDPANHILLSNRSAAELKQGNKSKALQDARSCVEANPSFAKGHSRLAAALLSLGRWEQAKSAYAKVLELDANNEVAKRGLEDCTKRLRAREQEEFKQMQEELQKKEKAEKEEENPQKEEKPKAEPKSTEPQTEEDDLLNDFFSEVETVTAKKKPAQEDNEAAEDSRENVIKVQKTDLGTAASQIERLLVPRYEWRNLNPFLVLDLPHTASMDDISRRYKALSLLLHPDKCRDLDRAKEAYDQVQRAKTLLDDEDKARHARQLVEQGFKRGQREWREKAKDGESLEEYQSKCVQRIFAEIEHKRREVQRRQQKQEQRERDQEDEEVQKEKKKHAFDKNWRQDTRVEKRIGNWRDFQKKGSSKKPKI